MRSGAIMTPCEKPQRAGVILGIDFSISLREVLILEKRSGINARLCSCSAHLWMIANCTLKNGPTPALFLALNYNRANI